MYIGIIVATTPELSLFHTICNSYCFEICNYKNTGNYPIVKSAILLLVFVVSVETLTSQLGITERLVFSFTSFILSCLQAPHLPAGFFKRDAWFSSLSFIIRCTFLLIFSMYFVLYTQDSSVYSQKQCSIHHFRLLQQSLSWTEYMSF